MIALYHKGRQRQSQCSSELGYTFHSALKSRKWNDQGVSSYFSAGNIKQNFHFTWANAGNNCWSSTRMVVRALGSRMVTEKPEHKRMHFCWQSYLRSELEGDPLFLHCCHSPGIKALCIIQNRKTGYSEWNIVTRVLHHQSN